MTPAIRASARHWIVGLSLAAMGVVVNRLVAPQFEERLMSAFAVCGQLVALGGLFVILLGIRRRIHRARAEAPPVE